MSGTDADLTLLDAAFTDAPGDSGFFVESEADLRAWIAGADSA